MRHRKLTKEILEKTHRSKTKTNWTWNEPTLSELRTRANKFKTRGQNPG